jgi:GlpG protein
MIRYQENNTYHIGGLRDLLKANEIIEILKSRTIQAHYTQDLETNEYHLFCEKELELEEARIVFLQVMGLYKKSYEPDPSYIRMQALPMTPVTLTCVIFSALIYGLTFIYDRDSVFKYLTMTNDIKRFLFEVKEGEFFRLITPIFLHFNFMHILFNLLWLKDLGKIIEKKTGTIIYILMIISLGLSSNFLQYIIRGPYFGGMSGVVYGLLGYLWMNKKFNAESDLIGLPKRDIYLMVGWFVLCMTGVLGPIANLAHGMGLSLGMLFGLWPIKAFNKWKWSGIAVLALALTIIVELLKTKGIVYFTLLL